MGLGTTTQHSHNWHRYTALTSPTSESSVVFREASAMATMQRAIRALAAGQATAAKRGVALSPLRHSLRSSSTILKATLTPLIRSNSCLPVTSSSASSSRMLHAALPLSHTCSSSSQALHGGQRRRMATVLSAAAPQTAQPVAEEEIDDRIPVTVRTGSSGDRGPWRIWRDIRDRALHQCAPLT